MIGNRKQLLALDHDADLIKADLRAIVRKMEARLGGGSADLDTVRSAAEQVVGEMRLAAELHDGPLRRLVNHGISQSVLGSTVFEALKLLFS